MATHASRLRRVRAGRRSAAPLLVVAAILLLLIAAAPASAAAPTTLDLDGLQAELTSQGTVDGFMKTSMSGTTVSTIPVKILAIVDGFSWGKLIMFECTDSAITDIGGIASGMSGSPVYVTLNGTDYMVGAVSYGDWFTLRGTGLATPIEYMTALQNKYGSAASARTTASTVKLDEPVVTSTGVIRKLVLGTEATATSAAADTSVMHPLAEAMITGPSSSSTAYKKLAAKLEDSGLTVLAGQSATSSTSTPDLAEGSPCGISFSTGQYALTVLGTVTYVDGDDVLMFGHPILGGYSGYDLGLGAIQGTLTGATVDAVWPSTEEPYKMMTTADAKGVAIQDRSAGVVAQLGDEAPTFPVSTEVSVEGGTAVSSTTDLGEWFARDYWPEQLSYGYASEGVTTYVAAAGLSSGLDSDPLVGSATTKTTVVASDGQQDYTFTRDNTWDNLSDDSYLSLADAAAGDVTTIMANVLDDPYDVRDVEIKSVDVAADFSTTRRYGGITNATTPRAIRWGSNTVNISYYHTGSSDLQTLQATLDVPTGTSLSGYLVVTPAAEGSDEDYYDYYYDTASAPLTMAETKENVDALPSNTDVIVAYVPYSSDDDDDDSYGTNPAAESTVHGDWVFSGSLEKDTATVVAKTRGKVGLRAPITLTGYVAYASDNVPVAIYCQEAGKQAPTKPTLTVTAQASSSMAYFAAALPGFKHNVLLTTEVDALSDNELAGADQAVVKVRAKTKLKANRRGNRLLLTARVAPADTTGKVVFQRRVHGRWIAAGSATLKRGVAKVKVAKAASVRARFNGGALNAASAWTTKKIAKSK